LLATTAIAAFEYYRQIRLTHKEYIKARDFVEDIVLSFDRELKRESYKFDSMTTKVEGSQTTAQASYKKAENIERKVEPLESQLEALSASYQKITREIDHTIAENIQNNNNIISGLSGLAEKLKDIESTQETLRSRIAGFEEEIHKLSVARISQPEFKNEVGLPPILIKRDKALGALTDTEIVVLEMLSKEGAKTAPEIKERVHLSREHTARLMKKLYEEGYLEREAGKIPFRYSIKKEMEALLQKAENSETV
jgi:DNA-binding MarR family transcriptional regulator